MARDHGMLRWGANILMLVSQMTSVWWHDSGYHISARPHSAMLHHFWDVTNSLPRKLVTLVELTFGRSRG